VVVEPVQWRYINSGESSVWTAGTFVIAARHRALRFEQASVEGRRFQAKVLPLRNADGSSCILRVSKQGGSCCQDSTIEMLVQRPESEQQEEGGGSQQSLLLPAMQNATATTKRALLEQLVKDPALAGANLRTSVTAAIGGAFGGAGRETGGDNSEPLLAVAQSYDNWSSYEQSEQ
jgi:hypothetical protein